MSVTTVSFAHTTLPSETYLTELGSSGPPYTVHGVALGAGDVTRGASGVKKKWPASELKDAADTLEETNLVVDHENNADGVVGQVRKAGYKEGSGVIYEAELYEEDLADKIDNGLLEVSIRGYHADVEELDEDEDTGALIVEDITFDNLSIVPQGASPSNTLQMGEHEELSAAALQQFTASLVQDPEPGMWVAYDGTHGITIGQPENGDIEVDVYEEQDGQWRSTGQTEMVATDDLSEWDVEESDIGPVSEEENEPLIEAGQQFFSTVNNSTLTIESVDGNIVTVSSGPDSQWKETMEDVIKSLADGDWQHSGHVETDSAEMVDPPNWTEGDMVQWQVNPSMVGKIVHNPQDEPFVMVEVMENGEPTGHTLTAGVGDVVPMDSEEMADATYKRGDWVRWDTRNSTEIGTVIGGYTKGDDIPDFRGSRGLSPDEGEILYALRMYDERDGTYHPIEGKPIGHYEDSVRSAEEPANVSDESVELGRSNHEQYDVEEEEWVQWYPSDTTEEHGFVLDVDDDTVTIEVWTQNADGEWETDGEEITKEMDVVEPWGNFPRKQEEFADAIEDGDPRKAVQPSGEENAASDELISEQVKSSLKDKAEEHNEEHGDEEGKEVTYRMLKNVFERGMGAYQDSHREGMTPQQWSYARVNAFLYLVRNGQPENDAYTQDNDLLPEDHPKYNETDEEENAAFEQALTTADVIVDSVFGEHDPMGSDEDETVSDTVERVVTAELAGSMDELDEVYSEWSDTVNMTASELQDWSGHPCSREASLDPVSVMERNLELLETNKSDWNEGHIEDAKRTISFISRMRGADTADKTGGPHGCPSKRDISLLNWAYNPFDELPAVPDDEALDSVEELYVNDRGEGEERVIQTLQDKIDLMRDSPHRSTPQEVAREADDLAADEGETHDGEASDVASLVEYEMHEVDYEGTHSNEWNRPNLEDFVDAMDIEESINEYDDLTTQAKRDVASAFIISSSGFPADNYGDLKLPVVEPSGELSRRALETVKGGRGVSAVDGLNDEMENEIINYVNQLARDEFDADWAEQEEANMPKHYGDEEDDQMMGEVPDDHMFESRSAAEDKAEDMGISGAHQMGEMYVPGSSHDEYAKAVEEMNTNTTARSTSGQSSGVTVGLPTSGDSTVTITTMNDELEAQLSALDSPVAVEAAELEALEEKADRLDTMSESLEELRERTSVLDEVDQGALEELREADDPVVVESDEHETLQSEAAQVKSVYAASLSEEYPAFDEAELSERYSIDELREKFEAEIGSVEEELAADSSSAEPRSQDPSEEELAGDSAEQQKEAEVEQKQQEIREKILG